MKVIKAGVQIIEEYTTAEAQRIKNDLTLKNPKFMNAVKYSNTPKRYIQIPEYLEYYSVRDSKLIVPIGYSIPFEYFVIEDRRVENRANFDDIRITPRKPQEDAYLSFLENPENGMIQMPTGSGKSILGLYLAYKLRQKTLIIVHENDLVRGWNKDIDLCFGKDYERGLIKAQNRKIEDITIATVQTLSNRPKMLEELKDYFGLIIGDECHHFPAKTYDLIENFNAYYKVGLSATPERSDGLDEVMNFYLGGHAYRYSDYEYENEDILPVKVLVKKTCVQHMPQVEFNGKVVDIENVPYSFRPNVSNFELDRAVLSDPKFVDRLFKDVKKEYDKGRSCIIFFKQVEACENFVKLLKDNGLDKSQLYYGSSTESDDFYLNRAEEKEVLITVSTYKKATEGTNVKSWEVAFLGSGVSNGKTVEQAIGRIRRTKKDKINPVLVYDYRFPKVYQLKNHGRKRDRRYKKLEFEVSKTNSKVKRKLFSRGY